MHLQIFDCKSKYSIYNLYHFSIKKKEKIKHLKLPLKVIIFYSREKIRFNCKPNLKKDKLANFWLDIINKINYKILVVILYTSLELKSKKIELVQKYFK